MITLKLKKVDIDYIVDELINANDAERYYIEDQYNLIDHEEHAELSEKMDARSNIIGKLSRAVEKHNKRSKRK